MKKNRFVGLLAGLLCLCLLVGAPLDSPALAADAAAADAEPATEAQPGDVLEDPAALAGEPEATAAPVAQAAVQFTAIASATLKVRRTPDMDSLGSGTIAEGGIVYVLELGNQWSKVDTGRTQGYVQTKYLKDLREYADPAAGETAAVAPDTSPAPTATGDTREGFQEKFKAYAYKAFVARSEMDDRSSAAFKVPKYAEVTVGAVHGDWCYIRYKNSYGYTLTSTLFKWDRIAPFAGDIPGSTKHIALAFLKHTTDIRSYADGGSELLKTVNPGTAVSVDALDSLGRYPLPYWRTTGFVNEGDVGYLMEVVPWEDAQSGELISCMSTFYAVGVHTLQYQGRNYNIYMSSSFISGLVVQPGETVNIYDIMGPYRKSTGYHRAPIMNPEALWGYGGGTCQVNTTLYNALIQVPILINWRKVHADVGIYYCPVGFDAAVGGGDTTMIFTNTLPYAIRINFFMSDGCLTVGLFRL